MQDRFARHKASRFLVTAEKHCRCQYHLPKLIEKGTEWKLFIWKKKKSPNATVFFVVFYIDEQNYFHEIL